MDRNTLFAFGLIAVVLILTPWYMKVVAPDPKVVSLDSLSTPIADDLQNNKNTTRPFGPVLGVVNQKNLGLTAKTVITVENNLYSVEISNISGGSFVSFVLNNYVKHDSSFVNVIDALNVQNLVVSFVSLDGDLVSLDHAWNVLGSGTRRPVLQKQQTVVFETSFNGYSIKKRLTFFPDTYIIGLEIIFENPEQYISRGTYSLSWSGGLAPTEKNTKDDYTYFKGYALLGDELLGDAAEEGEGSKTKQAGTTLWTATKTKYFISAIIPSVPGVGAVVSGVLDGGRPLFTTQLNQNTSASGSFNIYIGPLEYNRVRSLGLGLEKTMNLGWAPIRPLGRLITWSLTKMFQIIPNYGFVIIIFAFVVKILLNPLTKKSFQSTRRMQDLQPKIQALKEKHKNDPKKLNSAQAALFKSEGVNPLGGCLPMLLQMPILIAFFTIFRSTIEFRGAPFFGWITDLSVPDTLTTIAGFPINILPFLMGATMFLQQKLMASPSGGAQQKMMMYFMNVFFLFIFYSFPSGLNLYYSVFNVLSIVQQKYLTPSPKK
ncbi:MAG TPA: membrane protein insertase YidC, partial [Candidatus Marinimicrobia bacterium]|nr:membrane protein insertase YidC [Candidatus Neomarinimicrobiota bacterium]